MRLPTRLASRRLRRALRRYGKLTDIRLDRDAWKSRAYATIETSAPALAKVCRIMGWTYDGSHVAQAEETMRGFRALRAELKRLMAEGK